MAAHSNLKSGINSMPTQIKTISRSIGLRLKVAHSSSNRNKVLLGEEAAIGCCKGNGEVDCCGSEER